MYVCMYSVFERMDHQHLADRIHCCRGRSTRYFQYFIHTAKYNELPYIHTYIHTYIQYNTILVAATLKYADAILKTLATSASIVLSTYLGAYTHYSYTMHYVMHNFTHFFVPGFLFLNGPLDMFVTIGAIATILAIFNYTLDASAP